MWAHRTQEYATDSGKRFYFRGDVIYSYVEHFPIARHVRNGQGQRSVLFTSRSYSHTTACHKARVRSALHNVVDYLVVPDLFPDQAREEYRYYTHHAKPKGHRTNLGWFAQQVKGLHARVERARTNTRFLIGCLEDNVEEGNRYADFFGLKTRFAVELDVDAELEKCEHFEWLRDNLRARQEREHLASRGEQRLKRQAEITDYHDKLACWRAGAVGALPEMPWELRDTEGVALRVKGSRIQTSMGVVVSIDDAAKILDLVLAGKEVHFPYHSGERADDPAPYVGDYRVTRVMANGDVHVSCHFIRREEIERVATLLGLWPGNPPEWYQEILGGFARPSPTRDHTERRTRTVRVGVGKDD